MKRLIGCVCVTLVAAAVHAAGWTAGQGVANDRATGQNQRDVTFVQRGGGNAYGWRQYDLPIGLTVLPWSLPNFESSVYGLRINLGWGEYAETYGFDSGLISRRQRFGGVSWTLIGNWSTESSIGIEAGLVNYAGTMQGLQIGAVNMADVLYGVQIGLLNFNGSGLTLPILNVGW